MHSLAASLAPCHIPLLIVGASATWYKIASVNIEGDITVYNESTSLVGGSVKADIL